MSSSSPRRRRYMQVVDFCHEHMAATGSTPTYSVIGGALRIADAGTVRRYVKQAEAAGLVTLGEYSQGRGDRVSRIRLIDGHRTSAATA